MAKSSARSRFQPPLAEYRKKRDFGKTREPAGNAVTSRARLRFVVQEHHASILHYDFRLEIGGVLKSWSVPKGPSLDPDVKRLAVQVEDHPVDYLTFTGTIPAGSYGAGEVYRWDLGRFQPLDPDPLEAWNRGSLKFRLEGKRLKGEWRLVRTTMSGGRKPSWLLFKVRDAQARPGHVAERIGHNGHSIEPSAAERVTVERKTRRRGGPPFSIHDFLRLGSPSGNLVLRVDGTDVPLTNLDRVYWPTEGIRKFDLLEYYIAVWPRMKPYLEGRPAILHRYPQGVDGYSFVQHNLERVPDFVTTRKMSNEEGRKIDYALYTDLASLLYLTNIGTLEHHPWHSTVQRIDKPDWLALDLDPGRGPWEDVLDLALVLRDVLARRKLRGYPKTSGSRGLHVYIPLEPVHGYAEVARNAEAIAKEVVSKAPRLATVERSKSLRGERRIYVDWLQNARAKTLDAPYTARARAGATVSMPLAWKDLESGVRIEDFTIRSVPARAEDPWHGFFENRQRL